MIGDTQKIEVPRGHRACTRQVKSVIGAKSACKQGECKKVLTAMVAGDL